MPMDKKPAVHDREDFLAQLVGGFAETIETFVGLEEAAAFVAMTGDKIGHALNDEFRGRKGKERLDVAEIAEALVDLKRRIEGGFRVAEISEDRILLVNDRCPFREHVLGRTSLCMMTSNVFGRVAAENRGTAQVGIEKSFAKGDGCCVVEVRFGEFRDPSAGRTYFRSGRDRGER